MQHQRSLLWNSNTWHWLVRAWFFSHLRSNLSKVSVENELHFRPNIRAICLFVAVTDHHFLSALATILSTKPSSHLLAHLPKFHSSHNGFLRRGDEIQCNSHNSDAKRKALMFSHQLSEFPKKWLSDLMVMVITDWNFDKLRERASSSINPLNWCSIEAGCPISWASPSTTITKWTFLTRWMLFAVAFSRRRSNNFLTPRLPLFRRACIFLRPSVCNWIFALHSNCTSLVLWYSVTKGKKSSASLTAASILYSPRCTIFPKCVFWLEGRTKTEEEMIIEQNLGNLLLICRLDLTL